MSVGGRGWPRIGGLVVGAVVLVGAAAGCSSSSSSTTATTLSPRDAYRSQATAVCAEMKTKADAMNQAAATLDDESKLSGLLDQNVAILQSATTQLGQLTPDPDDAAAVKAYLAALDGLLSQTKTLLSTLQSGDNAAAAAAETAQQAAQQTANDAARAVGLDTCVIG